MSAPALVPALAVLVGVLLGAWGPASGSRAPALACVLLAVIAGATWAAGGLHGGRVHWWPPCWRGVMLVPAALATASFAVGSFALTARARHQAFSPSLCQALARSPPESVTGPAGPGGGPSAAGPVVQGSSPVPGLSPCASVVPEPVRVTGVLGRDAAPLERHVALELDATEVEVRGHRAAVDGGVQLRVSGSLAAAALSAWRGGRTVRVSALLREPGVFRDPGVADARVVLARRGVALVGTVKSAALVEVVRRGTPLHEAAAAVRAFARSAVWTHVGRWSARSATIIVAILIGDRAGLDPEVQRRLQEAGTYHVIAISGGNIAILTGVLLFVVRLLRLGPRWGSGLAILVLAAYAVVVGGGASVVRATVMAVVYFAGRLVDQRGGGFNAIAVAFAAILVCTPFALFDAGFLLTFGATAGIVVGARVCRAWHRGPEWSRPAFALFVASVWAEVALFPVGARIFSRVTFAGLIVNFAAIPLMALAQVAGMALVPAAWCAPPLASWAGWCAHVGSEGLVQSARLVDLLPWLQYRLPPPPLSAMAAYYLGWGAWLALRGPGIRAGAGRWRRWGRGTAIALIVVAGSWILVEPVTLLAPGVKGHLRLTVLDVGHADAILVQFPDRRSLLVDAGGSITGATFDVGSRVVAPALWALGTRRLDVLVISHPDPDHIGGAVSVVRDFRPRVIWEGVPVPPSPSRQALQAAARARGIAWQSRAEGDQIRVGDVTIRVWHPPPPEWERQRPRNDDSLVLEVLYGRVSIVLPGDIGQGVEQRLGSLAAAAGFRVLKVPHHGSATSSSPGFVAALAPRVAVLSAGAATRVGAGVLDRYLAAGATLFRTDRDGAVTVDIDKDAVQVRGFTGRRWQGSAGEGVNVRRP